MGDSVVSTYVKNVLGRLNSEAIQEFGLLWGFKDDILTVKDNFQQIEVVLNDAEEKRRKDKAVDIWLKSIRTATMMTENVLDDVTTEAKLQHLHKQRVIKYKVRDFFSFRHNQLMFRVRIAHNVKDIRRKLDAFASKRFELSLTPGDTSHGDVDVASEMPDWRTASHIFGRHEEREMMIERILRDDIGTSDKGEMPVYGIWGMGGVGKTTVAQLIYYGHNVNKHFEHKCWIYVSQNFQVKELIKRIIESIDEGECTLTHLDVLQESLQNKLRGKRFLIVLDDVWIEDGEKPKWDLLSETLSCGAKGSIVVMTTRSQMTIKMMCKVPKLQHQLSFLSLADSWLLFKKFAFATARDNDDINELTTIGHVIVEKCRGLPLVVKALGSLMWSKRSAKEWEHVVNSNIWELEESVVLPALKLSYDDLLPHLKQCFTYCCLFPRGYDLKKDVVIQLWVVNGFIPPRGETDLYELGEGIFSFLVWRSFFQVVIDMKHGNDIYKMHDLMYDMAQHVMRHDCLVIEHGDKEVIVPNEALHLSSSSPDIQLSPRDFGKPTSLRSIFMFGENYEFRIIQNINHMYVRVLYLCGIRLKTLPESICELKYLKYLNLSYSSIEVLPESIIYLQNLQVLLLNYCHHLSMLPINLRYMSSLRFLDISSCHSLLHLPLGIKEITNLRRLTRFHVAKKEGAKIGELGDLDRLEGELEISGLENVGDLVEAKSANLRSKINISVLKLTWSNIYVRERNLEMFENVPDVLEGLEPNSSLKKLSIFFYMGKIISPNWMVNLISLVEIGFSGCKRCESVPPLGKLPNLTVINLLGMDFLEGFHKDDMSRDTNMFPCLQELNIFMCPNLVSLPYNLPQLKILKLEECGALNSLPGEIQGLETLEISGCKHLSERCKKDRGVDWPKIGHIPNIRIHSPRFIHQGSPMGSTACSEAT